MSRLPRHDIEHLCGTIKANDAGEGRHVPKDSDDGARDWSRRQTWAPARAPASPHRPRVAGLGCRLFDGEGSTLLRRGYPGVSIHQAGTLVDPPEVLSRFQRIFGGLGYVSGPEIDATNSRHRPRWSYDAHGYEVVQAIIGMIWPWLGPVKRSQASAVLLAFRARPVPARRPGVTRGRPLNERCWHGHDYSDAYVDQYGRRSCRPCRAIAGAAYHERRRVASPAATSEELSDRA